MAAGKGTRMKSRLPKVLHRLAGRALVQHVIDTAQGLKPRHVVMITGHGAAEVEAALTRSAAGAGGGGEGGGGGRATGDDAERRQDKAEPEPHAGRIADPPRLFPHAPGSRQKPGRDAPAPARALDGRPAPGDALAEHPGAPGESRDFSDRRSVR